MGAHPLAGTGALLRIESVRLTGDFAALLETMGFPAPWEPDDEEPGNIHAANGAYVGTCDTNRALPDDVVQALTLAIILAVNTCAGFKAVSHG